MPAVRIILYPLRVVSLILSTRCFVYSDRPIRSPHQISSHEATCLSYLPGRLVYDDQEPSAEGHLDTVSRPRPPLEWLSDAPSYLNDASQLPKQEKEGRVRIYEVDPVISLQHKVGMKFL